MKRQLNRRRYNSHSQLVGLDIARFFAALLVMTFHLGAYAWQAPFSTAGRAFGGAAQYPDLFAWTWFGWVGVQIFFVISGFVIAYSAEHAMPHTFLSGRILRLVPAVWLCATLTLLVSVTIGRMGSGSHVLNAYFASTLFWPFEPWIDGVYWTLGVEISFYALILALLCARKFRWIGTACAAVGSISAAFWCVSLWVPGIAEFASCRIGQLTLLRHGCFFALGVFLWLALTKAATAGRLGMILLFLTAGMVEIDESSHDFLSQMSREGSQTPLVPCLIFVICVAAISMSVRWNAWLCDRAGNRVRCIIRTAGLMTYPLYLIHNVVGAALTHFLVTTVHLAPYEALAASCGTMVVMSLMIVCWPEPILRRYLADLLAMLNFGHSIVVPAARNAVRTGSTPLSEQITKAVGS